MVPSAGATLIDDAPGVCVSGVRTVWLTIVERAWLTSWRISKEARLDEYVFASVSDESKYCRLTVGIDLER